MTKVVVEVLMTDQWASGTYMVETVKSLPKEINDIIEVRVWNIKKLDGINRKRALHAKSIPSIALDHKVVFESTIPTQEDLIAAIKKLLYI